jgi:hypothetical protein
MKRYVNQIIEDIDLLLKKDPPYKKAVVHENFFDEMAELEEYFLNDAGLAVSKFSGIEKEHLPAAEILTYEQLNLLNQKILELLNYCNFFIDFPDDVPDSVLYNQIRENWERFKLPEIDANCHFEFCEYEVEKCPFPGYCNNCEKLSKELEQAG